MGSWAKGYLVSLGSWAKGVTFEGFLGEGSSRAITVRQEALAWGERSGFLDEGPRSESATMFTLVNHDGHVVTFPSDRLNEFCNKSRPRIHVDNMKELLGTGPHSKSRERWQPHKVQDHRLPEAVKYIRPVGCDRVDRVVPILTWRVSDFIANVAMKRDDMAGLRSEKNVTSFIKGHKIKGAVHDVYGKCGACPDGWELVSGLAPEEFLPRALLPWDEGYNGSQVRSQLHLARSLLPHERPLVACRLC